jgi:hypothetical protein
LKEVEVMVEERVWKEARIGTVWARCRDLAVAERGRGGRGGVWVLVLRVLSAERLVSALLLWLV